MAYFFALAYLSLYRAGDTVLISVAAKVAIRKSRRLGTLHQVSVCVKFDLVPMALTCEGLRRGAFAYSAHAASAMSLTTQPVTIA
ncbi:hypothetical protein ASPCADRAFT_206378 [Aspergillus carbonarius ITEM 5010]|uniref:Uncharacterized protein n=1 Tax=Aspergillus carbonarius (strain ITEM 5010) TaxID=602072 RepID=A0A1R3RSU7_ASPC5|nr:hypothetical protein ASPCADRAFT_206378 [Aspergillus carbonarius ITEM 5010]